MGNRGIIHDPVTKTLLNSRWQHQAWVCCRLAFKNFQHPVMGPRTYTELFFLDEVTALAAGHRPCAYCRRVDFNAFKAAWLRGKGVDSSAFVAMKHIDRELHRDRVSRKRVQIRYQAPLESLPDGTMVSDSACIYLVWEHKLYRWSESHYDTAITKSLGTVTVLTPRSIVAALSAGYVPGVHLSVRDNQKRALSVKGRVKCRNSC